MAIHFNAGEGPCIRRIANAVNKAGRPFLYATPGKMLWIRPYNKTGMITECSNPYPHISSDNPILGMLSIESELAGKEKTAKACAVINSIIETAKERIGADKSQFEKLQILYGIVRKDFEIQYDYNTHLLTEGLAKEKKVVSCDTGSFIFIAVAYELKWPIYLAINLDHAFIVWKTSESEYLGFETTKGREIRYKHCEQLKCEARSIVRCGRNDLLAAAHHTRGITYGDLGKYDMAIKDFTRAIELSPNFAEAYTNRGAAYGILGQHDIAIKDLNKAIELRPDSADAHRSRALEYRDLGEEGLALRDCLKATRLRILQAKNSLELPDQ